MPFTIDVHEEKNLWLYRAPPSGDVPRNLPFFSARALSAIILRKTEIRIHKTAIDEFCF